MKTENKLIAEFMQKGSEGFGLYDYNGKHYKLYELKFHTSWDWLMPVVHKCLDIYHIEQKNDDLHFKFYDGLSHSKEVTYQAVVDFIKLYNKPYITCDRCCYDLEDEDGEIGEHYCIDDKLYTPNN